MRPAHTVAAFCAALGLAAVPARAGDGILMAQKTTSGGKVTTHQTQIDKTRMRAETENNGRKMVMVFDGAAGVMRTIDEQAKTYTEMTRADVDRIGDQMSAAMAQVQQQMQSMSPEQRARVEAMMGRGIGAVTGPPIAFKKTGTDTVGRWTCDKYEGTKNGEKTSEMCTVDPSALGLTAADFDVARQFAEFFAKMVPQGMDALFRMGNGGPNGFSGIPVRMTSFRNGAPQSVSEITEVSRQNFPDTVFAVPAGYQKRDMPAMGRGRQ